MKKVIIPIVIAAVFFPLIACAQSLPVAPSLPSNLTPDIATLQHAVALLGGIVFAHPLTILFVIVGIGLFSLLPSIVSGLIILLGIAVLVYLFGH